MRTAEPVVGLAASVARSLDNMRNLMFTAPSRESSVERLIGGLTMALGIGALIPRPGLGLYSLLEQSGERGIWAMAMLTVGCWAVAASYLNIRSVFRIVVQVGVVCFWFALTWKFIGAQLWGAALQGGVVIIFAIDAIVRFIHDEHQRKRAEASPSKAKKRKGK